MSLSKTEFEIIERLNQLFDSILDRDKCLIKERNEFYKIVQQRWIPCKEELPEIGKKVLVTKKRGGNFEVCIARYNVERWCASGTISNENVLAWMPLPEPFEGR